VSAAGALPLGLGVFAESARAHAPPAAAPVLVTEVAAAEAGRAGAAGTAGAAGIVGAAGTAGVAAGTG
jgi:hypothetical protein